ncbi:copper amine oxidase N-terminal domain-containing protein [Brevibacillus fortis]|uniref:copper amine oxidase N-terminal domain-containing protein n=1 Tax=Brevibacillus fortis TaxID=2126352 RepID=UPI002E1C9FE1|nr:copper amine oxidase N-terminal domain-containing protein [Brevibacillus fortis]
MKTIRTGMMTIAALAVLGTSVVSATSEPVKGFSLNVNGQAIAEAAILDKGQQTVLVPLRPVAESLGFKVSWNNQLQAAEVQKGAISSYAKAGEDRYPYAKMYKTLGAEPRMINGSTYVPVAFVDEILQAEVNVSDDAVTVVDEDVAPIRTGTITRINKSDKGQYSVMLGGFQTGILLHLTEDTKITDSEGKALKPEDLKLGMQVDGTIENVMTASLPPQTSAISIVVKDSLKSQEVLGTAGKVTSISSDKEGIYNMLVEGSAITPNSQEKVMLTINKKTVIVSAKDNRVLVPEELTADSKVFAFYSPTMTHSLPPIAVAEKIVVDVPDQEIVDEDVAPVRTGTITSITKSDKGQYSVMLGGYETGIMLHLNEETKITDAQGKALKPEDLKLGMEVEGTSQKFMTMSLPPQSGAISIVVKDSLKAEEVLGTAGKVASISSDKEGTYKMLVEGQAITTKSQEKIMLTISEKTVIVSAKDNKVLKPEELKEDSKVFAFYSPMMTRSLPAIAAAEKIVVE